MARPSTSQTAEAPSAAASGGAYFGDIKDGASLQLPRVDLTGITERSQLPPEAEDYLSFIEQQVGVPVGMVGVGPGRHQVLRFAA